MPSTSPAASAAESQPPPLVQQIVSLLIVLHLVCVAIALSCYKQRSFLQGRLLQLFAPYTRTLNFAPDSAPFHLTEYDAGTGEGAGDDDVYIEIEYRDASGAPTVVDLRTFAPATPAAARRFRQYAAEMYFANLAEDSNRVTLFAQAIGGFAMRQLDQEQIILRLRRHMSQPRLLSELERGFPADDPQADAYKLTVYEADVIQPEGEPFPSVNKREAAGQTAPVLPSAARTRAESAPSTTRARGGKKE